MWQRKSMTYFANWCSKAFLLTVVPLLILIISPAAPANQQRLSTLNLKDGKVTVYRSVNRDDTRTNGGGKVFLKTGILIKITRQGSVEAQTQFETGLYTPKNISWHKLTPPVLFNKKQNKIYIFVNGKTAGPRYGMEGYVFSYDQTEEQWKKEQLYHGVNTGFYPFWGGVNNKGQPVLWTFRFAGYYAVKHVRQSSGNWDNITVAEISPDDAQREMKKASKMLITGQSDVQSMVSGNTQGSDDDGSVSEGEAIVRLLQFLYSTPGETSGTDDGGRASQYDECQLKEKQYTEGTLEKAEVHCDFDMLGVVKWTGTYGDFTATPGAPQEDQEYTGICYDESYDTSRSFSGGGIDKAFDWVVQNCNP